MGYLPSFRAPFLVLSFSLLLTFVSACAPQLKGNAEGYHGGDLIASQLRGARGRLVEGLTELSKENGLRNACLPSSCRNSQSPWCESLKTLTQSQALSCQGFLKNALPAMLALNKSGAEVPFEIQFKPLRVGTREVDAITQLGPKGSIIVDGGKVDKMTDDERLALLFHEFGHKIEIGGSYINDESPIGDFARGGDLLDVAASAFLALVEAPGEGFVPNTITNTITNTVVVTPAPEPLPTVSTRTWYRSYHLASASHFFTFDSNEHNAVVSAGSHRNESHAGSVSLFSSSFTGALEVYRLYKASTGAHFYTTDRVERDARVNAGWSYERVEGYVMAASRPGAVEILTLRNLNSGMRVFTTIRAERDAILSQFPNDWVADMSLGFTK